MKNKLAVSLLLCLPMFGCSTDEPNENTEPALGEYSSPESAVWNAASNQWYVSNIAGSPSSADGEGWISTVSATGEMITADWVSGLNAPKGMAILNNHLYVADLTEVVEIDLTDGSVVETHAVAGAVFLNDVTAGPNSVFVSDTLSNTVFELTEEGVVVLATGPELAFVNGLLFDTDRVLAVGAGDFSNPEDLGDLMSISLTGEVTVLASDVGKLDGLVFSGADLLATDYRGLLLKFDSTYGASTLVDLAATHGLQSAADLGVNEPEGLVAIPDLDGSTVLFLDLGAL